MVNPFYMSYSVDLLGIKTSYSSVGGELGYHYYTGERGANGFFIGPQLMFISSKASTSCSGNAFGSTSCSGLDSNSSYTTYGVAVDAGWQHVSNSGFTIGVGGGLMALTTSGTVENGTYMKLSGTVPRVLFTIGWSI